MGKDGPRPIDLTQLPLERSEPEAHLCRLSIGQRLDGSFVEWSGGGEAKVGSRFGDVVCEHLLKLVSRDERGGKRGGVPPCGRQTQRR